MNYLQQKCSADSSFLLIRVNPSNSTSKNLLWNINWTTFYSRVAAYLYTTHHFATEMRFIFMCSFSKLHSYCWVLSYWKTDGCNVHRILSFSYSLHLAQDDYLPRTTRNIVRRYLCTSYLAGVRLCLNENKNVYLPQASCQPKEKMKIIQTGSIYLSFLWQYV